MADRYLDFAEVQQALGLSPDEVRALMETKRLHGEIVDGVIKFREAEVTHLRGARGEAAVGGTDEEAGLVFLVDEEEEEQIEGKAYDGEELVRREEAVLPGPDEEIMEPVELSEEQLRNSELLGTDAVVEFGREVSERTREEEFGGPQLGEDEEIIEPSEVELPEPEYGPLAGVVSEARREEPAEAEPTAQQAEAEAHEPAPATGEEEEEHVEAAAIGPAAPEEVVPEEVEAETVEFTLGAEPQPTGAAAGATREELTFLEEETGPMACPVSEEAEAPAAEGPPEPTVVQAPAQGEAGLTFEEGPAPLAETVQEPSAEEAPEELEFEEAAAEVLEEAAAEEEVPETFEVAPPEPRPVGVTEELELAVDEELTDLEPEPVEMEEPTVLEEPAAGGEAAVPTPGEVEAERVEPVPVGPEAELEQVEAVEEPVTPEVVQLEPETSEPVAEEAEAEVSAETSQEPVPPTAEREAPEPISALEEEPQAEPVSAAEQAPGPAAQQEAEEEALDLEPALDAAAGAAAAGGGAVEDVREEQEEEPAAEELRAEEMRAEPVAAERDIGTERAETDSEAPRRVGADKSPEEAEPVSEERKEEPQKPEEELIPLEDEGEEGAVVPVEETAPAAEDEAASETFDLVEEEPGPMEEIEVADLEELAPAEEGAEEELVVLEEEAPVEKAAASSAKTLEEEVAELFEEEPVQPSPDEAFAAPAAAEEDFDLSVFQQEEAAGAQALPTADESLFEVGEQQAPLQPEQPAEAPVAAVEGVSRIRALTEERAMPSTMAFTALILLAFAAVVFTGMLLWHLFNAG